MHPKTMICYFISLVVVVSASAFADGLKLLPLADLKDFDKVGALAEEKELRDTEIFNDQSFRVNLNGVDVGTFVTGKGLTSNIAVSDNPTCFGAFVGKDGNAQLEKTAGYGYEEALMCGSALAAGIISDQPDPVTGCYYFAVLHDVSTPNTDFVGAYIFSLDARTHHFQLDRAATYRSASFQTKTIQDVRDHWPEIRSFILYLRQ